MTQSDVSNNVSLIFQLLGPDSFSTNPYDSGESYYKLFKAGLVPECPTNITSSMMGALKCKFLGNTQGFEYCLDAVKRWPHIDHKKAENWVLESSKSLKKYLKGAGIVL